MEDNKGNDDDEDDLKNGEDDYDYVSAAAADDDIGGDLQPAETVEILTVSREMESPVSSTSSNRKILPMPNDFDTLQLPLVPDKDESSKLRRPVRPVDRQRMRPWLMELLDLGNVYGLSWINRSQGLFQISWRHASRLGWNLETDGDVFERWARHTGIYKEGDPPEPKRWKANFRCALHSLHDVVELTTALERRGRNACRTYRFLHSTDERSINRKRAKARKAKEYHQRYERPNEEVSVPEMMEPQQAPVYEFVTTKILSAEDLEPATESDSEEDTRQDRVIVQQLELKPDVAEEEFGLHHDHDYSALPDKSQKTIVLRQGIGSIMLHKEVLGASEGELQGEYRKIVSSNLDQLASAAVSTASWNTVLAPGLGTSPTEHGKGIKQKIKTKVTASELATARLMRSEDQRAAYSLKYLLTGDKEDAEDPGYVSARPNKKRKTEFLPDHHHHASISVGAEETVSTEASVDDDSGAMFPFVPQKVSKTTPRRTTSPRILSGAKARRQRSKSEKPGSESTEPLMSSCLLLLEAATRLDNAEKDKTTDGVRPRGKGRASTKTSVSKVVSRGDKLVDQQGYESDGDSGSSSNNQTEDTMIITADQDLHRVLRKTLENLKNRTAKVTKQEEEPALTLDIAEEDWTQGTESVVVVSEGQEVKGLFSGSSIQSVTATADGTVQAIEDQTSSHALDMSIRDNVAETTVIEETIMDSSQGTEYVEMVIPEEEGIAYIQADSLPSEIIIEPVSTEQVITDSNSQEGSTTIVEHIPAGSILLQTGDGTPIGLLDEHGRLTAFQSLEARSVISLLASKLANSSAEIKSETVSAEVETSTDSVPEVPLNTTAASLETNGSQSLIEGVPSSTITVKQEASIEEFTSDQIRGGLAAVKVERVDSHPDHTSVQASVNSPTDQSPVEIKNLNPQLNDVGKIPCLENALLHGLVAPFTYEEVMSNFEKALRLHRSKSCTCSPNAPEATITSPISEVRRLDYLCKRQIINLCFTLLRTRLTQNTIISKVPARLHPGKKISVLSQIRPGTQLQQIVKGNSMVKFNSKTVMDPTTPFSLGEIPLFDSTKGDSDSMSPPSE
ncbi:interferon regulatory factor [Plakobranchus ocellatus]|uniref:Interferon regulatory factor n=1 Tax=Plakobranchus ocellatus TaxID=259542 RepID=A0AAV4CH23_9GAST|nr:interferon regulatory factor [Plakobranchus ocellatus]